MNTRSEKIKFFRRHLFDFFRKSGRIELPWRREGITAYEVWVSEVMLQQTQVSRVIGYYTRFLKKFPTVKKLAQASWGEFLPYYEGLGYYARGRNMLRTAKAVMNDWGGKFPKTIPALEKLPGIGPYTARAIASFAYDTNELAWDTNLKRVVGRFFLGAKDQIGEQEIISFNTLLGKGAREMNAALMDFGSAICTARPKCGACPLQSACRYFRGRGRLEVGGRRHGVVGRSKKKQAERALVFLHERHRQYFSSHRKTYQPFLLPEGYTSRATIKDYFAKIYGLTLAVRPPYGETKFRGQRVLLVNAQILLGQPPFVLFPKSVVLEYTKKEQLT